jgi:hypothetical protein
MSAAAVTGLGPSSRLLANAILAATNRVVRDAMHGEWSSAAATSLQRRALLCRLERERLASEQGSVEALRRAVAEAERALATMSAARVAAGSRPMVA